MVRLDAVAASVIDDHRAAPGATVAAFRAGIVGVGSAGRLAYEPDAPAVEARSPYDLASLTKPFVALTLARLQKKGVLDRGEPLGDLVPTLRGTASADIPIDLLAAHRAGLEAHQKLFQPLVEGRPFDAEAAFQAAAGSRRPGCEGPPPEEGFAPVYSDMGYVLLGLALSTRAGRPLDDVVRDEIAAPLGIADRVGSARQLRAIDPSFLERVAPTEDIAFRGGIVRGLVHDENAFAFSGDGLSGHAGLFGDAEAVLVFGRAVLDALQGRSEWLSPADLAPVLRRRPGGTHRAGFDGRAEENPSSGSRLGPETFGHLGFTGTSLWIDPVARFAGVLLTNRVHPSRDHWAIRAARPAVYDAMFDALVSARDNVTGTVGDRGPLDPERRNR